MTTAQATVRRWDASAGGSALLDDGREVTFPSSALAGARGLRLGQRVRLRLEDGHVVSVRLA